MTTTDDDAGQRRTIAVMLRVPPEQLARIEAGARALGLKRGAFFIMAASERALGLTPARDLAAAAERDR